MAIISIQINTQDSTTVQDAMQFLQTFGVEMVSSPATDDMDLTGGDEDMLGGMEDDDMLGGLDDTPAVPTPEDVLNAYKLLISKQGKDKANDLGKKLLAKVGAAKLSEVAEDKRAAIIGAFETLANK